jgi:hypothetical protein
MIRASRARLEPPRSLLLKKLAKIAHLALSHLQMQWVKLHVLYASREPFQRLQAVLAMSLVRPVDTFRARRKDLLRAYAKRVILSQTAFPCLWDQTASRASRDFTKTRSARRPASRAQQAPTRNRMP